MKKNPALIYFLLIPLLFFLIPALICLFYPSHAVKPHPFLSRKSETAMLSGKEITVLDTASGTICKTDLEEHLVGVLAAEMPASYESEALKAQAVAARSFIMSKIHNPSKDHPEALVCTDQSHCKAWLSESDYMSKWAVEDRRLYRNKLIDAVNATAGEYMVYGDQVVEAFFFAGSGGRTESSEEIWGGSRPYLQSVESEGDIYSPHYKSQLTVSTDRFYSLLKNHNPLTENPPIIGQIQRTQGGSVSTVSIGGQLFTGSEIRSIFGLKSANFTISASKDNVTFNVLGYGHGVGMSQFGANYMAKNGKKYTEILSHYYTNIQIIKN